MPLLLLALQSGFPARERKPKRKIIHHKRKRRRVSSFAGAAGRARGTLRTVARRDFGRTLGAEASQGENGFLASTRAGVVAHGKANDVASTIRPPQRKEDVAASRRLSRGRAFLSQPPPRPTHQRELPFQLSWPLLATSRSPSRSASEP